MEHVFQWITGNGPAPNIEPRFARIEIVETIAVVHLKSNAGQASFGWGGNARASDVFTLPQVEREEDHDKLFHWHDQ